MVPCLAVARLLVAQRTALMVRSRAPLPRGGPLRPEGANASQDWAPIAFSADRGNLSVSDTR